MSNYHLIQQLQLAISQTRADITAEQFVGQAMEQGLTYDDFIVRCDSLFSREHNKDIVYTDIKEDARKMNLLQLHVSRSGLFDHLPEGLFFEPAASPDAAAMAVEYRMNREKETAARHLFHPFENDFFWQRVQLEREESAMLQHLQTNVLEHFFGATSSLLPYAYKIAGNLPLTAQCLEALLNEPVQVNMKNAPITKGSAPVLGNHRLAVDMVCGEQFMEDHPVIAFTIGPLQNSVLDDYLPGGSRKKMLETFYGFFVPAEAAVITQLEPTHDGVLGYMKLGAVA